MQSAIGHLQGACFTIQGNVTMHFAIHLQPWRVFLQQGQGVTHFHSARFVGGAKVRVRQQGRLRVNAKALHFVGGHDRNFSQLLCRRVVIDMRVDQKNLSIG